MRGTNNREQQHNLHRWQGRSRGACPRVGNTWVTAALFFGHRRSSGDELKRRRAADNDGTGALGSGERRITTGRAPSGAASGGPRRDGHPWERRAADHDGTGAFGGGERRTTTGRAPPGAASWPSPFLRISAMSS